MTDRPRRPRRIAADEAHAWARNLRLRNPYAKLVLGMLTLYVNGEGSCFVSIAQLADDCEFAPETVRRRLLWLESIGAVVRFPQWRDGNGRLNGDGRGKRTTDDIRLMINTDPDEIEARAAGDSSPNDGHEEESSTPETDEISHPPRKVADFVTAEPENPISPPPRTLAAPPLRRGPNDSEPEPEKNPPNPPSGGGRGTILDQGSEDRLLRFVAEYPIAVTDYPKVRAIWATLAPQEQEDAILGAKGYASFLATEARKGRSRNVKDAHRWLRDRLWMGYLKTGQEAQAQAQLRNIAKDSLEGLAWAVIHKIGRAGLYDGSSGYVIPRELTVRELAFANAPPREQWLFIAAEQTKQIGAWNSFLAEALHGRNRSALVSVNGNSGRGLGFMAPWPWPPKSDGTVYLPGSDPPQERVEGTLATEQDLREFTG